MSTERRRVRTLIPIQYNSLEELRNDKRRLGKEIHKSVKSVREGVRQSFMPQDSTLMHSSSKYLRFVGYGLTAWKTARTVSRFVSYLKRK